jgi:hypothetical protein
MPFDGRLVARQGRFVIATLRSDQPQIVERPAKIRIQLDSLLVGLGRLQIIGRSLINITQTVPGLDIFGLEGQNFLISLDGRLSSLQLSLNIRQPMPGHSPVLSPFVSLDGLLVKIDGSLLVPTCLVDHSQIVIRPGVIRG